MQRIRKILVATDFSERALRAEARAAMLSVALRCETLEIMAVKNPRSRHALASIESDGHAANENVLTALAERGLGNVRPYLQESGRPTCIRSVRFGKPVAEILARADELPADVTVVGMHGGSFFTQLFLGYNTDKLVRMSKRPLLIVKNQPQGPYQKVLVAVDFSNGSKDAARMALEMAPAAQVTFLHVFHLPFEEQMRETGVSDSAIQGYRASAGEKARQRLDRFIADLGPRRQLLSRAVHHGSPASVIGNCIKQMGPDLVAMGKHGRARFEELMLGSVTRRMIGQTPCDLLVATTMETAGDWHERPAA